MKTYPLLIAILLLMLCSCTKKDRDVNDLPQADSAGVEIEFTPYTVTYKGGKYNIENWWSSLKDTPVYFYVRYFAKDSLRVSCTGVYPGGNSGETLTVDEQLYKNDSAIYHIPYSDIRRIHFRKDSIVFEWYYRDELFKDPTGGTHRLKSWAYGINVKSHFP